MKVRANWMADPLLHLVLIAAVVAMFASARRLSMLGPRDGSVLIVRAIDMPDRAGPALAGGPVADVGATPASE